MPRLNIFISVTIDYSRFLSGPQLVWSQITAMTIKKFLYSIRNYILLIFQFAIPALFVVITMLISNFNASGGDLPSLPIAFEEYLTTVTTIERGAMESGSFAESIFTSYENIISGLSNDHTARVTTRDFQVEILEQYERSMSETNLNFMVGVSISDEGIRAWFNNQGFHTAPLTINTINNAILRSFPENAARAINLVNRPLPFTHSTRMTQLNAGNDLGFNLAFNAGFGMAFVTAMFVMFYIKERMTRAKLLQFVSGVNKVIFWMTSFIIDYLTFILISLLFIGVIAAYQEPGYSTLIELSRNLLILAIFGFAVLPFTYVLSMIFDVPSSGLVRLSIGYVISGAFFFLTYFVLNNEFLGLEWVAQPLGWVFLLFPHYSLTRGMSNLNMMQSTISLCDSQCAMSTLCVNFGGVENVCRNSHTICDGNINMPPDIEAICGILNSCCDRDFYSFGETGIGMNLSALVLIGTISFILLFTIEYRWIQNLINKCKKEKP